MVHSWVRGNPFHIHTHLFVADNPGGRVLLHKDSFDNIEGSVENNLLRKAIPGEILVGKVGLDQHRYTVDKEVDCRPWLED
jgi:hypothetical protein